MIVIMIFGVANATNAKCEMLMRNANVSWGVC